MKKIFGFLTLAFVLVAIPVSAATIKVGEIYEHKQGSISDDIYIAGGTVDVTGDVIGDSLLAGGEVFVAGKTSQDVTVAGGAVNITGAVGDDVRVAAGNISISSKIGDDLVAAAGFVKVLSKASVAGDAVIAGGAVYMNGAISGDLTIYGEEVVLNGTVGGDVTLNFTKKVTLGKDARILGNLTYSANEELVIPEGATIGGEITRVEAKASALKHKEKDIKAFFGVLIFGKFLIMLIAAIFAVLVFKKFSLRVGADAYKDFWKNALIGFISLIVVPIITLILFITILGSYIGVILLATYALMLLVAKVFGGIVAGALLSRWIMKEVIVDWKWTIFGVVLLHVIILVPIIGALAAFIVCMASFGTILIFLYKKMWLTR